MTKRTRSDAADILKAISKQPTEQPEQQEQTEQKVLAASTKRTTSAETSSNRLEKRPKEQLNTTVDPEVKRAITLIQQDVQATGAKKPKIGEVIEQAIFDLLKKRNLEL